MVVYEKLKMYLVKQNNIIATGSNHGVIKKSLILHSFLFRFISWCWFFFHLRFFNLLILYNFLYVLELWCLIKICNNISLFISVLYYILTYFNMYYGRR